MVIGRSGLRVQKALLTIFVFILFLAEGGLLDLLGFGALDHSIDVDALDVDVVGLDLANLDNVIGLDNGVLGVLGHGLVEVVLGRAELAVTEAVGTVDSDECHISEDSLLHDIALAVEFSGLLRLGADGDGTIGVVADRNLTGFDCAHPSLASNGPYMLRPRKVHKL